MSVKITIAVPLLRYCVLIIVYTVLRDFARIFVWRNTRILFSLMTPFYQFDSQYGTTVNTLRDRGSTALLPLLVAQPGFRCPMRDWVYRTQHMDGV